MMRPRLVSTSVTEHSSHEESFIVETEPHLDALSMKDRIQELEAELYDIQADKKDEEKATRKLKALVQELTIANKETKEALDDALSWTHTLLRNSEKWMAIWESEIGKKALNARSSKLAGNAILAASVTQQVEYTREWIERFHERKAHYEITGTRLCDQMKEDFDTLESEIYDLRRECAEWEKRFAFNMARTKDMLETKRSVERVVDEKKMLANEIKNDVNEFERELLACSHTLDQIALS